MAANGSTEPPDSRSAIGVTVTAGRLSYEEVVVFDDLSVRVEAGAITCLLGPSGIGKTSLLRLIAGLAEPQDGTRVECSDRRPIAGRLAYMDQRDLLLPWLDAIANVTLESRLRGGPADRARALGLLERVGLAEHANEMPARLSGGMRQRVALARTLMENHPVVLMDEPFAAIDALTRMRLQELAAEMLRDRTVLLVTHDPFEALRLGHRIHVMSGRPAHLDEALAVPGAPPRDPTSGALVALHRDLLRRLGAAQPDNGASPR